MTNLQTRLTALEQTQRRTRPALIIFLRAEQEGEPTPAQHEQIAQAEKQGREVELIIFRRAEDSFPGFTGLPPER
ncbi:MAG: hypothetical protein Q7U78_05250 [Gallionella sp.]|nr:hypothetical protein [Gallionella sp.]